MAEEGFGGGACFGDVELEEEGWGTALGRWKGRGDVFDGEGGVGRDLWMVSRVFYPWPCESRDCVVDPLETLIKDR